MPEDYEGAVPLRSNHAAAVLGCCSMPDFAQFAQELGEVLGLHFPAQRGGPDQIREKYRQSMTCTLSSFSGLCVYHRCGGRLALGKAGSWLVSDRLSPTLYALAMYKPTETCLGRNGIQPKFLDIITYLIISHAKIPSLLSNSCECRGHVCPDVRAAHSTSVAFTSVTVSNRCWDYEGRTGWLC